MSKLHAITLVLASQRSGSTLLCRDIASLGGMGEPKEYFLDILGAKARPDLREADVLEQIAQGERANAAGVGAVKLMLSYAPKIDQYIRQADSVAPRRAVQNVIDWAQGRFERVNLVALVRNNSLEQAMSRAVAGMTDVWHRNKVGAGADPYADAQLPVGQLNRAILQELPLVMRQNDMIRDIAKANAPVCQLISYEQLAASAEDSSALLTAHARQQGFAPQAEVARRSLRKLIDKEMSRKIKADFKSFMQDRLAQW